MEKLSVFGGTGFVGGNYVRMYPEKCTVMPREDNVALDDDVLYFISTTHNYNVFTDVHMDINTNLNKLMDVLPPTVGTFNFISSWFSYGDFTTMYESPEADEDAVCRPKGFYSITKKCAEDLLISYSRTFDKSYRILRLCNVMGGDPKAGKQKNAFEFIISKIAAGEDVNIYRGDNFRNVMHVDDVCRAINLIVERGNMNEIYNVGNTSSVKLIDLVDYAISRTGSKSKINYVDAPRFHQIVQSGNFFMNCKKLQSLGFKPKYTITGIVDSVLDRLVIS